MPICSLALNLSTSPRPKILRTKAQEHFGNVTPNHSRLKALWSDVQAFKSMQGRWVGFSNWSRAGTSASCSLASST